MSYPMANGWVKASIIYSCNGILVRNKKEQVRDTSCIMDECQKQYAKWEKPDTEDCMLYDSFFLIRG